MVSRPRQPIITGEDLLRRYDSGVRLYWLRDWQSGFGGYTKYMNIRFMQGETKRKFSVAYVVWPRTEATNACLCFTMMSKMPDGKPWSRSADERDPSRGVLLDLQANCDWKMDSTVLLPNIDPVTALDDNMQVQCLPVYQADQPKWRYRRVPKVSSFRTFARLPSWCRKPQAFTYHMCAENITKTTLVPALSEEDRKALLEDGVAPPESSAKDRFCVMCPAREGLHDYSHTLPVSQLVSHWLQLPDTPGQSLSISCANSGSKRKIIVLRHPYHEDYVVLPTRQILRPDNKHIERHVEYKRLHDDTSVSRWRPTSWLNFSLRSTRGSQQAQCGCMEHRTQVSRGCLMNLAPRALSPGQPSASSNCGSVGRTCLN